jgi:hypothetical protein
MALPPDDKEAKKHWLNQEAPLGRPFGTRDPGLTQVSSPGDIREIVTREAAGEQVPTYRQRTSSNLPDPVARAQGLMRQFTQKGISADKFMKQCETVEDMILFMALYGDMADDKKGALYVKLSKILFDAQKEVQKQNNIALDREARQIKNTLENQKKLQKLLEKGAITVEAKDVPPKDGAA